jgi:hypothetical protein
MYWSNPWKIVAKKSLQRPQFFKRAVAMATTTIRAEFTVVYVVRAMAAGAVVTNVLH